MGQKKIYPSVIPVQSMYLLYKFMQDHKHKLYNAVLALRFLKKMQTPKYVSRYNNNEVPSNLYKYILFL